MDQDSSSKFIGSLTKFLQSLCNGYVEFQRGVELVGHIYLNIDTGEKVDYVLHEKVSKNDENSVSFVSNSFHAQPQDKKSTAEKKKSSSSSAKNLNETADNNDDDDDDIMIVDQSSVPGSTNSGTISNRSGRHSGFTGLSQQTGGSAHRQSSNHSVSSPQRNRQQFGPSATVTSQNVHQENINIGNVKLEQISSDELLSLASQVGDSGGSQEQAMGGHHAEPTRIKRSNSLGDAAGQPVWIKEEIPDDGQGGSDTGWGHSRDGHSDTSNSGSDLYPVMMHPAYSSNPAFPGSSSGPFSAGSHHGQGPSHPGMSGNLYGNPMPGTSQGMSGLDPAVSDQMARSVGKGYRQAQAEYMRQYRARMRALNPEKYQLEKMKDALRRRKRRAQLRMENQLKLKLSTWSPS